MAPSHSPAPATRTDNRRPARPRATPSRWAAKRWPAERRSSRSSGSSGTRAGAASAGAPRLTPSAGAPRLTGRTRGNGLYSRVALFFYDVFSGAHVRRCGARD